MSKINSKALALALAPAFAYLIQNTNTDVDNTVVEELEAALAEVQAESKEPVTEDEAVAAVFKTLHVVTDATPTKWDDRAVSGLETLYNIVPGVKGKVESFIDGLSKDEEKAGE